MYSVVCVRPGDGSFKNRIYRRRVKSLSEIAKICTTPDIETYAVESYGSFGITPREREILMSKCFAIQQGKQEVGDYETNGS